jgi:hypothetical protein
MDEEMAMVKKNKTWDLVPFLMDVNLLTVNGLLRKNVVLMEALRSIRHGWSLRHFHKWRELIIGIYILSYKRLDIYLASIVICSGI